MKSHFHHIALLIILMLSCSIEPKEQPIQDIKKASTAIKGAVWLSHEHIFVDFSGANNSDSTSRNHDLIIKEIFPYLMELKAHKVKYFVDATPTYLGKDVLLLEKIADLTGMQIITNTGYYGAVNDKFIPKELDSVDAIELSQRWINEFENGIDGTSIKPGFIKVSVDNIVPLDMVDQKLLQAAALTHLSTGLTIGSHTGEAKALWPQLEILSEYQVSAEAFIWIHAQNEKDNSNYLKAAQQGCWISLDGIGQDGQLEKHIEKLIFAKENGILDNILISHDSGWFDPQKKVQKIKPFTNIFTKLIPALKEKGFTELEINQIMSENPSKAFSISIKRKSEN